MFLGPERHSIRMRAIERDSIADHREDFYSSLPANRKQCSHPSHKRRCEFSDVLNVKDFVFLFSEEVTSMNSELSFALSSYFAENGNYRTTFSDNSQPWPSPHRSTG